MSEWRRQAEELDDGVAIVGPDRRVKWANRRFAEFFGLPPGKLDGHELAALLAADIPALDDDDAATLRDRSAWEEHLRRELSRARRSEAPVAVAMLALDAPADVETLAATTGAWRAALRGTDTITRYNTAAVGVVLPDCPMDETLGVVQRLLDDTPEGLSASAGMACWDARETEEQLAARALSALRDARARGGGQAMFAPRA